MKPADEIVVIQTFTHSIAASLAKSKLDAHGIPCFLTEENLVNLYPIQNALMGVRLHVFQSDEARARAILAEENSTS
jgi:hypothetical protein